MRKENFPIVIDLSKISAEINELEKKLNGVIIGQPRSVRRLVRALTINSARLKHPLRPEGLFIFAGPTGSGKTSLVENLSRFWIGGDSLDPPMTKINGSEFSEKHFVTKLIGGAHTYVGYGDPTQLDQFVIDRHHFLVKAKEEVDRLKIPADKFIEMGGLDSKEAKAKNAQLLALYYKLKPYRSVILFDEIEEAHPAIYGILLQIADYGQLIIEGGNITDFRNSIIILTTNIGSKKIKDIMNPGGIGYHPEVHYKKKLEAAGNGEIDDLIYKQVRGEIFKYFPPKFIGRFRNSIIVFHTLKHEHYLKILDNLLIKAQNRISMSPNPFIIKGYSDDAKEFILQKGIDPEYGARPLENAVETYIVFNLSKAVSSGEIIAGDEIFIDFNGENIIINRKQRPRNHKPR